MDSIASKVRRMSLVDNVNISQDGRTYAAFDMNDKVELKESPDVAGENLKKTVVEEKGSSLKKVKNIKFFVGK